MDAWDFLVLQQIAAELLQADVGADGELADPSSIFAESRYAVGSAARAVLADCTEIARPPSIVIVAGSLSIPYRSLK